MRAVLIIICWAIAFTLGITCLSGKLRDLLQGDGLLWGFLGLFMIFTAVPLVVALLVSLFCRWLGLGRAWRSIVSGVVCGVIVTAYNIALNQIHWGSIAAAGLFMLAGSSVGFAVQSRAAQPKETHTKTKAWFIGGIATLLLLATVAVPIWRAHSKSKCAIEGQAAVEAFLEAGAGGAFTNVAVGSGVFTNYGTFIRLEGSGYGGAVWNIQGYEYITLHRTAHYSGGSFEIKIHVTEGRRTAPGLKTVGIPKIEFMSPVQGATIFVSHPDLK